MPYMGGEPQCLPFLHLEPTGAAQPNNQRRARRAHSAAMSDQFELLPSDYAVVVKRRVPGDKPWRWEIWVAGRSRPVARPEGSFATIAEAMREGKAALKAFLDEQFPSAA